MGESFLNSGGRRISIRKSNHTAQSLNLVITLISLNFLLLPNPQLFQNRHKGFVDLLSGKPGSVASNDQAPILPILARIDLNQDARGRAALKEIGIPGAIAQKPFPGAGPVEGGLQVGEGFVAAEGVGSRGHKEIGAKLASSRRSQIICGRI
jgi:hypothetical protein